MKTLNLTNCSQQIIQVPIGEAFKTLVNTMQLNSKEYVQLSSLVKSSIAQYEFFNNGQDDDHVYIGITQGINEFLTEFVKQNRITKKQHGRYLLDFEYNTLQGQWLAGNLSNMINACVDASN